MRLRPFGVLFLVLIAFPLLAAKFWDKTPYQKWSQEQCKKVLTNSPWVYRYNHGEYGVNTSTFGTEGGFGEMAGRNPSQIGGGNRELVNTIQFRFVTSKAIKMAIGRLRLLQNPTDLALKTEVDQYVNSVPEKIVVEVSVGGKPAGHHTIRELENFFRYVEFAALAQQTYLASSDRRVVVPIEKFMPLKEGDSAAFYIFPRFDEEGDPYFTGEEKAILLNTELDLSLTGGSRKYKIQYRAKRDSLKLAGELTL
jgi:hypothetical protein